MRWGIVLTKHGAPLLIFLCAGAGLVLRCLMAHGGLWTDEAWSVVYARYAGDAWGVLTRINHDNNHHLNSLWILLMGHNATPFALRSLSIAAGTGLIAVLGQIALRRSALAGVLTAALAAVCPMLVVYGSEARGYSCAILACALMIARLDAWLADDAKSPPRLLLTLIAAFGTLAHAMMLPAIGLLSIWLALELRARHGHAIARRRVLSSIGPALLICIALVGAMLWIAIASPLGLRVGGYQPFAWRSLGAALGQLLALSTGLGGTTGPYWPAIMGILALLGWAWLRADLARLDRFLFAALILGMPLGVVVLHPGNTEFPRYYLTTTLGLALWLGAGFAGLLAQGGARGLAASTGAVAVLGGSLIMDGALISNARGHPEAPVAILASRAPGGTALAIETQAPHAHLAHAADQQHYPLALAQSLCGPAPFRLIERKMGARAPAVIMRCGQRYALIGQERVLGPSGVPWALYQGAPQ